ncbi:MAG: 2-C-methyl-D-erythritol 2,4-cyclodiphosphate synthase [Firmicutes bacterium]|nr:2-C-methyl-D-erythritol 2,4-cyclodiphosphate synthase [Bacillota bacterium]
MVTAIIAAAGSGKRMGKGCNKVFLTLGYRPVLEASVEAIASCPEVESLIVVVASGEERSASTILEQMRLKKHWQVVTGGHERQHSIANALTVVPEASALTLVHDGARPLVSSDAVRRVIEAARSHRAAVLAVPVKDTIKSVADGVVATTLERGKLWAIQTPQVFESSLLKEAYERAEQDGFLGTDDASLLERIGVQVKVVTGSYENLKITTPEDLLVAEALIRKGDKPLVRVGTGYDVHQLTKGRRLILGGVEVPYVLGLEGHSDADVLIHAVMDALLGAAALGDIGRHFPDTDEHYKGASSLALLAVVHQLLVEKGWTTGNVDAVVIAEKPKLAAYISEMNANIAGVLGIETQQVNIKATTTERLGFTGRGEGIAAQAVVTIIPGL